MDPRDPGKKPEKRVIKIDPSKLNSNVKDSLKLALAKMKGPTKSAKSADSKLALQEGGKVASALQQQQHASGGNPQPPLQQKQQLDINSKLIAALAKPLQQPAQNIQFPTVAAQPIQKIKQDWEEKVDQPLAEERKTNVKQLLRAKIIEQISRAAAKFDSIPDIPASAQNLLFEPAAGPSKEATPEHTADTEKNAVLPPTDCNEKLNQELGSRSSEQSMNQSCQLPDPRIQSLQIPLSNPNPIEFPMDIDSLPMIFLPDPPPPMAHSATQLSPVTNANRITVLENVEVIDIDLKSLNVSELNLSVIKPKTKIGSTVPMISPGSDDEGGFQGFNTGLVNVVEREEMYVDIIKRLDRKKSESELRDQTGSLSEVIKVDELQGVEKYNCGPQPGPSGNKTIIQRNEKSTDSEFKKSPLKLPDELPSMVGSSILPAEGAESNTTMDSALQTTIESNEIPSQELEIPPEEVDGKSIVPDSQSSSEKSPGEEIVSALNERRSVIETAPTFNNPIDNQLEWQAELLPPEKEPAKESVIKAPNPPPKPLQSTRPKPKAVPIVVPKRKPRFKASLPVEKPSKETEITKPEFVIEDPVKSIEIKTPIATVAVVKETVGPQGTSNISEPAPIEIARNPLPSILKKQQLPEELPKAPSIIPVTMEKCPTDLATTPNPASQEVNKLKSKTISPLSKRISRVLPSNVKTNVEVVEKMEDENLDKEQPAIEEMSPGEVAKAPTDDCSPIAEDVQVEIKSQEIDQPTSTEQNLIPTKVISTLELVPPPANKLISPQHGGIKTPSLPVSAPKERPITQSTPLASKVTTLKRKRDLVKERALFEDSPHYNKLCEEINMGSSSLSESEDLNDDEESITISKSLFIKYFNKEKFLMEKIKEQQLKKKGVVENYSVDLNTSKTGSNDETSENIEEKINHSVEKSGIDEDIIEKVSERDQILEDWNDNIESSDDEDKPDIANMLSTLKKTSREIKLKHIPKKSPRQSITSSCSEPPISEISCPEPEAPKEDDPPVVYKATTKRASRTLPKALETKEQISSVKTTKEIMGLIKKKPSGLKVSGKNRRLVSSTDETPSGTESHDDVGSDKQDPVVGEGPKKQVVEILSVEHFPKVSKSNQDEERPSEVVKTKPEKEPVEDLVEQPSTSESTSRKSSRKAKDSPLTEKETVVSQEKTTTRSSSRQSQWNIVSPSKPNTRRTSSVIDDHNYSSKEDKERLTITLKRPSTRRQNIAVKEAIEEAPPPSRKKLRISKADMKTEKQNTTSSEDEGPPMVLNRRSRTMRRAIQDDEALLVTKDTPIETSEDYVSTDIHSENDTPRQSTRPVRSTRQSIVKSPEPPPKKRGRNSNPQKENEVPEISSKKKRVFEITTAQSPTAEKTKTPTTRNAPNQSRIEHFFTPATKDAPHSIPKFHVCGNCKADVELKTWKKHMVFHNGLGWIEGIDEPLDLASMPLTVMGNIIQSFMKKNNLPHAKCEKCPEKRRSGLGIVSHAQFCGMTKEEIEVAKVQCDYCPSRCLPVSMASHLLSCSGLKRQHENADKQARQTAAVAEEDAGEGSCDGQRTRRRIQVPRRMMEEVELADHYGRRTFSSRVHKKWVQEEQKKMHMKCFSNRCSFKTTVLKKIEEHHNTCEKAQKNMYGCKLCLEETVTKEQMEEHLKKEHFKDAAADSDGEDIDNGDSDAFIGEESSESEGASGTASQKESADEGNSGTDIEGGYEEGRSKKRIRMRYQIRTHEFFKGTVFQTLKSYCRSYRNFIAENNSATPLFEHWTVPEKIDMIKLDCKTAQGEATGGFVNIKTGLLNESISWVPLPVEVKDYQVIAILCKPESLPNMKMSQTAPVETIIQLWKIAKVDAVFSAQHLYSIVRPDGPIFGMKFLPSGGHSQTRLGVMAITSLPGDVNIVALPLEHSKYAGKGLNLPNSCVLKSNVDAISTQLVWSEQEGHNLVVAGFLNGMVAIWRLGEQGKLLVGGGGNKQIFPYKIIQPFNVPIIHLSMNNNYLLVAGSIEVKILNLATRNIDEISQHKFNHYAIACAKWLPNSMFFAVASRVNLQSQGLYVVMPLSLGITHWKMIDSVEPLTAHDYSPWLGVHVAGSEAGVIYSKQSLELEITKETKILSTIVNDNKIQEKPGKKLKVDNPQSVTTIEINRAVEFKRWCVVGYERGLVRVNLLSA